MIWPMPVSYTHLDVYKRQPYDLLRRPFAGGKNVQLPYGALFPENKFRAYDAREPEEQFLPAFSLFYFHSPLRRHTPYPPDRPAEPSSGPDSPRHYAYTPISGRFCRHFAYTYRILHGFSFITLKRYIPWSHFQQNADKNPN